MYRVKSEIIYTKELIDFYPGGKAAIYGELCLSIINELGTTEVKWEHYNWKDTPDTGDKRVDIIIRDCIYRQIGIIIGQTWQNEEDQKEQKISLKA